MIRVATLSVFIAAIFCASSTRAEGTLLQDVVLLPANTEITPADLQQQQNPLPYFQPIVNQGGGAFRVRIEGVDVTPTRADWYVELEDDGGNVTELIRPEDLADQKAWYSGFFFGSHVRMTIRGTSPSGFGGLKVVSILRQAPSPPQPQSAGNPILDFFSPAITNEQKIASASVVKLELGKGHTCSGFYIGPTHIVTNRHCINKSDAFSTASAAKGTPKPCGDAVALSDFVEKPSTGARYAKCIEAWIDEKEDLAVLRVDPLKTNPPPPLILADKGVTPSTKVYSVGHPLSLPITFTRCCGFFDISNQMGTHDCPTFAGGSGSPIFDEAHQVVAVNALTDYDQADLKVVDVEAALRRGASFRSKAILLRENAFVRAFIGK